MEKVLVLHKLICQVHAYLAQRPGYYGFDNRTALVVEKVDFINNEQSDFLGFQRSRLAIGGEGDCKKCHTDAISPSPVGFRVTTSHFSGVVTMI